jgi:hypothetical protein
MKIFIIQITALILILSSCQKSDCINSEKAVLKDLTGLDGCGIVIELANGTRLEPVNLSEFPIIPEDGKKIWVKYHITAGGSICMVGDMVEIDCILERK